MTLRDNIISSRLGGTVSTIADVCEYGFFLGIAGVIFSVMGMGAVYAYTGAVSAIVGMVPITVGILVVAVGMLLISILIGFFEQTYSDVNEDVPDVEEEPQTRRV